MSEPVASTPEARVELSQRRGDYYRNLSVNYAEYTDKEHPLPWPERPEWLGPVPDFDPSIEREAR